MDIYLQKDGQQQGPFSENRIRQGIDVGEFVPADLAWTNGQASWQPLSSLIALDLNQPPPIGFASSNKPNSSFSTTDDQDSAPPPLPTTVQPSNKNTLRVSKTGSGDFSTITEAIAAAHPGARIIIEAGTYEESLIITKPLTLVGKSDALVAIYHPNFSAVKVVGTEAIFHDITIGISYNRLGISIVRARVDMIGCKIRITYFSQNSLTAVSESSIRSVSFSDESVQLDGGKQRASSDLYRFENPNAEPFFVGVESNLNLLDSLVDHVFIACVGATITLSKSSFFCCGIAAQEESKVEVNDCTFKSNQYDAAVFACSASTIVLKNTNLSEVFTSGILCAHGSHVKIEKCVIAGAYKLDDADSKKPYGLNRGQEGYPYGILIHGQTNLDVNKTSFSSLRCGIFAEHRETGKITIRNSELSSNRTGISVNSSYMTETVQFEVTVTDSEILDNDEDGIRLYNVDSKRRRFYLRDCKIKNNCKHGVSVSFWTGTIEKCEFGDNTHNFWCSDLFFLLNHVRNCKGVGESKFVKRYQFIKGLLR